MAEGADWRLVVDVGCSLGEGVCWHAPSASVLFVDIHGQHIHAWSLVEERLRSWPVPQRIGWLVPCEAGGHPDTSFVAGLQQGFARIWLDGPAGEVPRWEWLARVFEGQPALRLNDAKADASGRIWAGSLNNDDESRPDGGLFRFDLQGQVTEVDTGYGVANGPAISPDGRLFLHTDSARRIIYAFDFDAGQGRLDNKRVWRCFEEAEGYPDGMSFDADGCVWVAHWGGACISRFDAAGRLMRRVELPVSHVTNVAFGGERLDRLFVTSARAGLSPEKLEREPWAGGLFEVVEPGVSGLPPLPWKG